MCIRDSYNSNVIFEPNGSYKVHRKLKPTGSVSYTHLDVYKRQTGIVLCADKGDSIVKYTLPEDNHQIFASKYFTDLPSEEELKRELNLKEFRKKE